MVTRCVPAAASSLSLCIISISCSQHWPQQSYLARSSSSPLDMTPDFKRLCHRHGVHAFCVAYFVQKLTLQPLSQKSTGGLLFAQVKAFRIPIRREVLHQSSLQHPFTVSLKEASHLCLYVILHTLQHPFCSRTDPCADIWG